MLDFRKVLLAAAVAGLGLVGTASAQITCNLNAPTVGAIHAEGLTEQLPNLTFTCNGTPVSTSFTVTVTTNAPIANVAIPSTTVANQIDAGISLTGVTGVKLGVGTAGSTSVTFTVPVSTTTAYTASTLTITNLRVNASGSPVGTSFTALASGSGISLYGTTGTTSVTAQILAQSYTSLAATTAQGYFNVAVCNVAGVSNSINVVATAVIGENFVNAFATDTEELTKETGTIGTVTGNPITAQTATGTRIAVTFNNLAAGVTYYIPSAVTSGTLSMVLIPSATTVLGSITSAQVAGITTIGVNAAAPTSYPAYYPFGQQVANVYPLQVVNGSATAYYAVTADSQTAIDATGAGTATQAANATPYTYVPLGTGTANAQVSSNQVNLYEVVPSGVTASTSAPVTINTVLVGNTTGYAQYAAPATLPVATVKGPTGVSNSTGLLTSCNTTLVFPYLLTSSGYDTGIAIANTGAGTSAIPGGSYTAVASGTCNVTLYGAGSLGGTALTPIALSAITVPSGNVFANNLSRYCPALRRPSSAMVLPAVTITALTPSSRLPTMQPASRKATSRSFCRTPSTRRTSPTATRSNQRCCFLLHRGAFGPPVSISVCTF